MKAIILTNAVRSFITLCSAVMIFISSIFGFGKSYSVENDYLIPLLKAMEKEDTEAIYDMFAADVTKSDKNLKRDIERLVKMYDGKLILWTGRHLIRKIKRSGIKKLLRLPMK